MTDLKPIEILAVVMSWPRDLRDEFDERAGILEYEGNATRDEAERRAYLMLRDRAERARLP